MWGAVESTAWRLQPPLGAPHSRCSDVRCLVCTLHRSFVGFYWFVGLCHVGGIPPPIAARSTAGLPGTAGQGRPAPLSSAAIAQRGSPAGGSLRLRAARCGSRPQQEGPGSWVRAGRNGEEEGGPGFVLLSSFFARSLS